MSFRSTVTLLFFMFGIAVPASGVAAHDCSASFTSGGGVRLSLIGVKRIWTHLTEPYLVGTYYGWLYIGTYRGVWEGRPFEIQVTCGTKIPLGLV